MKIFPYASLLVVILLVTGCAARQVELTERGKRVRPVPSRAEVWDCKELGVVYASSSSAIHSGTRLVNARNKAAELGGNRILPGRIDVFGEREFQVFLCP
jgi:hypothetical protein